MCQTGILCAQRPSHQLNTVLGSLLAHLESSANQNGHQLRCRFEDFTGELRLACGWAMVCCRLVYYFTLQFAESLLTWQVCIPWKVSTFLEGP